MTTNNLPLIDNCCFIDNSALEHLTKCPRSMEYYFIRKRVSGEGRSGLNFGGAMHAGLERWFSLKDGQAEAGEVLKEMKSFGRRYLEEHPTPLGDFRTADFLDDLFNKYQEVYLLDDFNVVTDSKGSPIVEQPFAHEIHQAKGIRFIFTGKLDVVTRMDKGIFPVDHKSTSMMGPGFWEEQAVSPQHEGYAWAWWKTTGELPIGYVINAVRIRPPNRKDSEGVEVKKKKANFEKDDFVRQRFFVDLPRIMEWENNVKALLDELLWHHERNFFSQKKAWCVAKFGKCQYYDVCNLPAPHRETMLSSGLYVDSTWSPLNK